MSVFTMREEIRIIQLPKIPDERGNLSFFEGGNHIPFEIKRTYWVYDVPGGEVRGGHSYKNNKEFIIALSGSFDIVVDDGMEKKKYFLNRSYMGLYIPNGYWRHLENFSTNSLALIIASETFDPSDYERDYEQYKRDVNG